jgi:hypothetical protein
MKSERRVGPSLRRRGTRSLVLAAARLGLAVLLLSGAVLAGPPFVTDDPEPVDYQHWEVYIASLVAHDRDGTTGTGPHIEVNYGAIPDLQVHIIAPFAFNSPNHGGTQYGYGDTELGVKYRFLHETRARPQAGIFPLLEIPTGSSARGLGSGHLQAFIPIWLQKRWGAWQSYGGGGYWHNPGAGNRDYWLTGWQIQRDLSKTLTLGAEIYHTTPSVVGGGASTNFNLGGFYNFDEGHHLLFSAGRGIQGPARFLGYFAFQWTFGPKEKKADTAAPGKKSDQVLLHDVAPRGWDRRATRD